MTKESAGLYICSYQVGHAWSPQSDPVPLVMTGAYDKPSLYSVPDTVVSAGQGGSQASFIMDPVKSTQAGSYRCFGHFHKTPYVWSHPSDPVQLQVKGQPVTITCSGHPNAEYYQISKVETPGGSAQKHVQLGNTFHHPFMTKEWAGLYICSYKVRHAWSPQSDPQPLVMTGAYDKPSLDSVPDTVVSAGQRVQMQCFSRVRFDELLLVQGSGLQTPQKSSFPPRGGSQASFIMDPVKSTQAGSYRCFGHFHKTPYVWSHPSDPVQLQVKDTPTASSQPPTTDVEEDSAAGTPAGNAVRLGLAGLVLLLLLAVLAEAWLSWKTPIHVTHEDP
ncbi:leukocyte immunoglobulin-like receptor subfamily A member 2 [Sorex fumeus]|uniref:leukocyte immunoglobulin-like receptor subfamily A member 2 n=1 Tax=Sorex fumeus TaxID=62283 RepID=UPI0024AE5CB5|nr:leukocyte immunoglobulin-like receptor subfamily A member 2 [Sorex fumeus]